MDIERLNSSLGPNKVTQQINTNLFMQGENKILRKPREHVDIMAMMASADKQQHRIANTQHLHVQMLGHLQPRRLPLPPPPPPPPPPRVAVAAPVQATVNTVADLDADGYTNTMFERNTFLTLCLFTIDPSAAVMRKEDATSVLSNFMRDLGKNLDNDKQLFRAFGFSRKRNSAELLDNMKRFFASDDTDALLMSADGVAPTTEVFTYMSKLLQKNICIVDYEAMIRKDHVSNPLASWVLFKKSGSGPEQPDGVPSFSLFHNPQGVVPIGAKIEADLVKKGMLSKLVKEAKASYVNKLGKMIGLSKDELLAKYA
jgi:hypothetical protein